MSKKEALKYVAVAKAQKAAVKSSVASLQKQALKKASKTKLPFLAKTNPAVKAGLAVNFVTNAALVAGLVVVIVRAFKKDPELQSKVQDKVDAVKTKVKKVADKVTDGKEEVIEEVEAVKPAPPVKK